MKKLFITFVVLISTISFAELSDFRDIIKNISPDNFELNVLYEDLYPDSLTIFTKGHPLEWEADNISDFSMYDGELSAVSEGDIIHLPQNLCGGLVSPEKDVSVVAKGDFLIATGADKHYLYYLPDCAQYNYIPRSGHQWAISDTLFCELSYTERVVRDLFTGYVLFIDSPESNTVGVYGAGDRCFFIQRDGEIHSISSADTPPTMFVEMELDEEIYGVTSFDKKDRYEKKADRYSTINAGMGDTHTYYTDGGFAGFLENKSFVFNITTHPTDRDTAGRSKSLIGMELMYYDLPQGVCMMAENSETPFCSSNFDSGFAQVALNADKVAIGDRSVVVLTSGKLQSFQKNSAWVKEFMPISKQPQGCWADGIFYFTDYLGDTYYLEGYSQETISVPSLPDKCDGVDVRFVNGDFLDNNGYLIYEYSDMTGFYGDTALFKYSNSGKVVYANIKE